MTIGNAIAELLSSEASLGKAQNHEGRNCRETRKRIESTRTIQQLQRSASMVDKLLRCSCSISDSTSMDKISASRKIKSATKALVKNRKQAHQKNLKKTPMSHHSNSLDRVRAFSNSGKACDIEVKMKVGWGCIRFKEEG